MLVIFASITIFAQDGAYQQAMGQALGQFAQAKSAEDLHAAANSFERISTQAEKEYLPHYYAALVLINSSFTMKDVAARDEVIDRALKHVKSAESMSPGNDEVEVLNGYGLMAKMVVDPQNRAPQYSPIIMQSFGKAMGINPENPRALAMMARQEMGTAQYFGSDISKACGLAQKSIPLFEMETEQGFEPRWGKDLAQDILSSCK